MRAPSLPARLVLALAFVLGAAAFACEPAAESPSDADVCERATQIFSSCGVVLPTLAGTPCTGAARLLARCVVDHGQDCDELASLTRRIDACVTDSLDGGDLLPPAADLPVLPAERGADASADAGDAAIDGAREDGR
jgi:hypothetical protein